MSLGANSMSASKVLELVISPMAQNDLARIWSTGATEWGRTQADRYAGILAKEIKLVCHFPDMGVSYDHIKRNYRGLHVERHIVIYAANDTTVWIVRILYGSMDVPSQL